MKVPWHGLFSPGGSEDTDDDIDALRAENESLRDRIESLEREKAALNDKLEATERASMSPEEIFTSLGESVATANESLLGVAYQIDALDITLKSRLTIGDDGIRLIVDEDHTDEPVDEHRISDVKFRISEHAGELGIIGEGEPFEEVPDIRELSLEQAEQRLADAGFETAVESDSGGEAAGIVLGQDPPPYVVGPAGETVTVTVGEPASGNDER